MLANRSRRARRALGGQNFVVTNYEPVMQLEAGRWEILREEQQFRDDSVDAVEDLRTSRRQRIAAPAADLPLIQSTTR